MSTKKYNVIRKSIFVVFTLSIFLGLILAVALVLFLWNRRVKYTESVKNDTVARRIFQTNPYLNDSSHGIVNILVDNEEHVKDFISYRSNGYFFLISNFETQEYQCYGTCYCENTERKSANVMKSGLFYLVAAASSLFAFNIALEYFEQECVSKEMSSFLDCSPNSIKSDVERCDPIVFSQSSSDPIEIDIEYVKKDPGKAWGKYSRERRFVCSGTCMFNDDNLSMMNQYVNTYFGMSDASAYKKSLRKICEKLTLSETVSEDMPVEGFFDVHGKMTGRRYMEMVFMEQHLKPLCDTQGNFMCANLDEKRQIDCSQTTDVSICIAFFSETHDGGDTHLNPSIHCVEE